MGLRFVLTAAAAGCDAVGVEVTTIGAGNIPACHKSGVFALVFQEGRREGRLERVEAREEWS